MGHATAQIFFAPPPLGPGQGPKSQISSTFNFNSQFQRFSKPNFVCLFTNEKDRVFICWPVLCSRGGTWGWGEGQEFNFLNMVNVAYQINWDDQ